MERKGHTYFTYAITNRKFISVEWLVDQYPIMANQPLVNQDSLYRLTSALQPRNNEDNPISDKVKIIFEKMVLIPINLGNSPEIIHTY